MRKEYSVIVQVHENAISDEDEPQATEINISTKDTYDSPSDGKEAF